MNTFKIFISLKCLFLFLRSTDYVREICERKKVLVCVTKAGRKKTMATANASDFCRDLFVTLLLYKMKKWSRALPATVRVNIGKASHKF